MRKKERCLLVLFLKDTLLKFLKASVVRTELTAKTLLKKTPQNVLEKAKAQAPASERRECSRAQCPLNLFRLFSTCDYENKLKLYFPSS